VLRVEKVINNPGEFRARRQVLRHGKPRTERGRSVGAQSAEGDSTFAQAITQSCS